MLQSIRDKTHGWIAGIIISLLILSFALWGIHSYTGSSGTNNVVAKVNGTEITKNQLASAYERLRRQMQIQSGSVQLSEKAEAGLQRRALDTLIHFQVLEQASIAQNYRITPNQIDGFLQAMPEFQVNGEFSPVRFQQVLNAIMFTPAEFVELIKATLLTDQPRLGITLTSFALPDEITRTMALIGQERDIRYLSFSQRDLAYMPPVITDEMLHAYYAKHEDDFKTPEQVSVEYILLSVKELADKMKPSDEQLKSFYAENMSSFKQSKKQTYSAVKDQVRKLYARQKAEEQFADMKEKIANVTYEHPDSLQTASQQFNLPVRVTGMFAKDQPGKDISANVKVREIAFGNDVLNLQNNSDVIQLDPDSVIVLRIKSHVPAAVMPLSSVRRQIEDKLKSAAMEEQFSIQANEMKDGLQSERDSAQQIAEEHHLHWVDVGFIGRHASKIDQAILNKAFQMPEPQGDRKTSYAVAKVAGGFAIIELTAVRPGKINTSPEQNQAFADQIQNSAGTLEYELYKSSLMRKAKIVIEN